MFVCMKLIMDRVLLLFLCLLAQWIYQVSNFKSSFVSITFSSKHISTFSSKTRYPHAHLHIMVSFQFQIHSSLNITAGHFPRQSDNLIQSKHGFILSYSERISRLNSIAQATLTPLWFKVIPQSVTPCLHLHLTYGLNAVVRSELRADERRWYHGKPTKSLVIWVIGSRRREERLLYLYSIIYTASDRISKKVSPADRGLAFIGRDLRMCVQWHRLIIYY